MKLLFILTDKKYHKDKWNHFFADSSSNYFHFKPFINLYEFVFLEIVPVIDEKFEKLCKMDHAVLQAIIFQDITGILEHILGRCCVREFYLEGGASLSTFVGNFEDERRIKNFIDSYPLLEERLLINIRQYIMATSLLISRFLQDYEEIVEKFVGKKFKSELIGISRLGDPHYQANAVSSVTIRFQKEKYQFIYKPHEISIDIGFMNFIKWLNNICKFDLKTPQYLLKNNYGWVEYIKNRSCHNEQEIKLYYERLGALLFIVYCFYGTDIHSSNLIACEGYPVIIDLEGLFEPIYSNPNRGLVIFTAMLPRQRLVTKSELGIDISAYSGISNQTHPHRLLKLINGGKANIRYIRKKLKLKILKNIPRLKGKKINPGDYNAYFISGFKDMYRIFLENKNTLLSENSPLQYFNDCQTRIVLRNTSEYHKLICESTHPDFLIDKNKYQEHITWLGRENSMLRVISVYDIKALKFDTVPRYVTRTDQKTIEDMFGDKLPIVNRVSGLTRVKDFIQNQLNEQDLRIQLNLVKQTLQAYNYNTCQSNVDINEFNNINMDASENKISQEINFLSEHIKNMCIVEDKKIYWTAVNLTTNNVLLPIKTTPHFYDGVAGILFALSSQIQENSSEKIIKSGLIQLENLVIESNKNSPGKNFTHGYKGIIGLIYALYHCSKNILIPTSHPKFLWLNTLLKYTNSIKQCNSISLVNGLAGDLVLMLNLNDLIAENVVIELILRIKNILKFAMKTMKPDEFLINNMGVIWALTLAEIKLKDASILNDIFINQDIINLLFESIKYNHLNSLILLTSLAKLDNSVGMHAYHTLKKTCTEISSLILNTQKINLSNGLSGFMDVIFYLFEIGIIDNTVKDNFLSLIIAKLLLKIENIKNGAAIMSFGLMTGYSGVLYQLNRYLHRDMIPSITY